MQVLTTPGNALGNTDAAGIEGARALLWTVVQSKMLKLPEDYLTRLEYNAMQLSSDEDSGSELSATPALPDNYRAVLCQEGPSPSNPEYVLGQEGSSIMF